MFIRALLGLVDFGYWYCEHAKCIHSWKSSSSNQHANYYGTAPFVLLISLFIVELFDKVKQDFSCLAVAGAKVLGNCSSTASAGRFLLTEVEQFFLHEMVTWHPIPILHGEEIDI